MMFALHAKAQTTITMPADGCRTDTLHAGLTYTILDPGGTGNYPNSCNSTLTLVSDSGTAITISGVVHTEYNSDFFYLYEGKNRNCTMLDHCSGLHSINSTSALGAITLALTTNSQLNYNGFALTVSVCDMPSTAIYGIVVDTVSSTGATLTWNDSSGASSWTVHYGTSPEDLAAAVTTAASTATLNGLTSNTTYFFAITHDTLDDNPCAVRIQKLHTPCDEPRSSCVNYSDLSSCFVKGNYGIFVNPRQHDGIIDYGSGSSLSRHTVHTDTTETDPRTGNLLHTIPPGYTSSVRLGNWETGGQAESITYQYDVDTSQCDLLLLRYAAVLQVPNHTASEQPRFSFMILDEDYNEINSSCYSANFVASTSLGWNIHSNGNHSGPGQSSTLWKDWTSVGIDLTPLHGQTIFIRLTTSDCSHQQHYGYAYFVIDCSTKTLTSESCGTQVENTFTAPDGFSYQWYMTSQPSVTLSTAKSLHVTLAGEYRCRLGFVGAPAGADCSFELAAIADVSYPTALMSWDSLARDGCDLPIVLHNSSVISRDTSRHTLTTLPCDAAEWIVDSLPVSTDNDPTVILTPGQHTVQLVASLNGGCTDTASQTISVPNPCYRNDTIVAAICHGDTAWLFDTPYTEPGTFCGDSGYHHRTLVLSVSPTYDDTVSLFIVQNQLPYSFAGIVFSGAVTDTSIILTTAMGCDSTIHFSLTVFPNTFCLLDSTVCEDALPLTWHGHTFSGDSSVFHFQFTTVNHQGADSTVFMTLHVKRNSAYSRRDTVVENQLPTLFGGRSFASEVQDSSFSIPNSQGCDSLLTYSLHVWFNVHATADSSICDTELPFTWNGMAFNSAGNAVVTLAAAATHGEDSILTMRLHVRNSSDTTISDTIVENLLPLTFMDSTFFDDIHNSQFVIQNSEGCDSTIHYSLHVWRNTSTTLDTSVCADMLPFSWHSHTFVGDSTSFTYRFTTLSSHGADSVVTLTLTVNPVHDIHLSDTICDNQLPFTWHGLPFSDSVLHHQFSTLNSFGCDSTVHLTLTVNPTHTTVLSDTICSSSLPYSWLNHTFSGDSARFDYRFTVNNVHGCDSTITLLLTVHPSHHVYHRAVVCDGVPYRWIDGNTYNQSTYDPKIFLVNSFGCDSVLHLLLDLDDNFKASMEIAPALVDIDHPDVRLHDRSESHSRQWHIISGSEVPFFDDTSRFTTFRFPQNADSVSVLLVARTMAGCTDSVWATVHSDQSIVWAPNAITPDEPTNNRFTIQHSQLAGGQVWIYSRAGMLVSHFDVLTGSWDGTYNGKPCPQGSYTWVMRYRTLAQPQLTQTRKGTVTVVR